MNDEAPVDCRQSAAQFHVEICSQIEIQSLNDVNIMYSVLKFSVTTSTYFFFNSATVSKCNEDKGKLKFVFMVFILPSAW